MREETIETLKKYSQEQILEYLPYLTEEEQKETEQQVKTIDFEQLQQLYELAKQEPHMEEKNISHISYVDKMKIEEQRRKELEEIGRNIISKRKICYYYNGRWSGDKTWSFRTKRNLLFRNSERSKIFI
ncbi:MAG: hypothetical protein HFJ32_04680 [Clostridia bacterium]|nr:hypothetical protein [Clostridia bacterium]